MRAHGKARRSAGLLAAALVACASPSEDLPPPQEGPVPQELVTSLEVKVGESPVRLRLHATNMGDAPVELEFSSGQRFDFAVYQGEQEVWRWSEGMGFTQALGSERVAAGETLAYEATWDPGSRAGTFRAVGTITTMGRSIQQETTFVLPVGGL